MATQLFLRNTASDLGGAGQKALGTVRGAAATTAVTTTVASGTNIVVTQTAGGQQLAWFSAPLAAQTLTGTVDVNIRGQESAIAANAGAGVLIERVNSAGVVQSTILTDRTVPAAITEYTTTEAAKNSTALAVTSTTFVANDRIKVTLKVRNVGTMGAGTVTNRYDGPTAAGSGDTYVTFSQTLTFGPISKSGSDTSSMVESEVVTGTGIPNPPTFPDQQVLPAGTGIRSFSAVTTQAGDWLVCEIVFETALSGSPTLNAPGLTFTQRTNAGASSRAEIWQFTAQDTTGGSRTLELSGFGSQMYLANLTVVRGSDGPGNGATSTTGQTTSLARSGRNSAVFMTVSDWLAGSPAGATWAPGGSTIYAESAALTITGAFGRWDNAGISATQTTGMTSPVLSNTQVAVLEMLGQLVSSETPVSGSDTATGTDAGTLAIDLAPPTDTGSSVDAGTLATTLTGADTSTATESATLTTLTPKSGSDTALMVDAGTLLASFTGSDLGASLDAPSGPLSAILTGADTGTRVEAYQLSVVLQSADTGAQTDAGSVAQGATDKTGAETATAVDAATLAASQTRADTAGAADVATLVVNFTASELLSIVDTVQALAAAHTSADTSSQTESQTVNAGGSVSGSDTSSVAEGRTLTASLTGSDTSTGTENQTVIPTIPQSGSDTSSATENRTLAVQLTAAEIVSAIEGFALSTGGNVASGDSGLVAEQVQLMVQVTKGDIVTSSEQSFLTLFKVGADASTMVDSASLLAQLTLAEIVAAAEVLAVLTGPKNWNFIGADVRAVTRDQIGSASALSEVYISTSVSLTISF